MAIKRLKPRSPEAQLTRMRMRWPDLEPRIVGPESMIAWVGPLRGFQMSYQVQVQWDWRNAKSFPHVFILEPALQPRLDGRFVDIPHLLYNHEIPTDSALCLFDPKAREWDFTLWISDTTVPWASEWLHHYELWHVDGIWRGANAPGPISIGAGMEKELAGVKEQT
jgi:hypothetical protein